MKISERLTYWGLTAVFAPLSLLPLKALYLFADTLAWLARSVVGYRVKVVRENLASSFPEKSAAELHEIEKGFYRFLADYFVETVKLYSMSEKFIRKHLIVVGTEKIDEAMARGRNCSLMLGHYCNWEWISSFPIFLSGHGVAAQIYHPLENRGSDKFFARLRTRFKAENIAMNDILPSLIGWKREGIPSVTGYIADQAPSLNVHLFVDFLNHETNAYTGPERISRFLDAEVFYLHISRPRRGYYRAEIIPITEEIKKMPVFEPSRIYFQLLERNIREAPQYWLWSHRRWKRTREMFDAYFGNKAAEQLSHL
ncbi:MAG: lysophospholipid acyltransferase family protein [Muribaculaceae bacterium]|nr:lysophospholipid acyltransferase family protein [Muribaculaceae bacterium]